MGRRGRSGRCRQIQLRSRSAGGQSWAMGPAEAMIHMATPRNRSCSLHSSKSARVRAWQRLSRSDARQAAQLKHTQRTSRGLASASSCRTRWGLLVWLGTQNPSAQPGAPIFPWTAPTSPASLPPPGRLSRWTANTSRPKWPQTQACSASWTPGESGQLRWAGRERTEGRAPCPY